MAGANTLKFSDATFDEEVLQSAQPVLVDFWAEWCNPCKALGPTIDALATHFAGRAAVGKLDTDANPQTATRFGISAIPTVILFHKGEIVEKFIGLRSEKDYRAALDGLLG